MSRGMYQLEHVVIDNSVWRLADLNDSVWDLHDVSRAKPPRRMNCWKLLDMRDAGEIEHLEWSGDPAHVERRIAEAMSYARHEHRHDATVVALRLANPMRPHDREAAPVDGLALFDAHRSPALL